MPCTLNRIAWEKLINEDIDWLDKQPDTLEAKHIRQILEWIKTHRPDKQTELIKELENTIEKLIEGQKAKIEAGSGSNVNEG